MRRFHRSFSRKREPTAWDRANQSVSGVAGGALGIVSSFGGTADEGTLPLDRRLTLLRFKCIINVAVTTNFTVAAGDQFVFFWGVAMLGVGEPTPDPRLPTGARHTDWLHLEAAPVGPTGVSLSSVQGNSAVDWRYWHCDIKAKRKVDSDEVISVIGVLGTVAGTAFTAGALTMNTETSALFQRTRK